jgi:hypothetical protein
MRIIIVLLCSLILCSCASTEYETTANLGDLRRTLESARPSDVHGAKIQIQRIKEEAKIIYQSQRISNTNIITSASGPTSSTRIFHTKKDGTACTVYVIGYFDHNAPAKFLETASQAVREGCKDVLVKMDSLGGQFISGIRIGLYIHHLGWDTMAWKPTSDNHIHSCVSACAIAFLGGKRKYRVRGLSDLDVVPPFGDLGLVFFHQISRNEGGKKICIQEPTAPPNLIMYEYVKLVFPVNPELLMGKILNEACDKANFTLGAQERISEMIGDKYTQEIYRKFE